MKAEKPFDHFTIGIATEGIHNFFGVTGCSIKHINHIKAIKMTAYAKGLTSKYKLPAKISIPAVDATLTKKMHPLEAPTIHEVQCNKFPRTWHIWIEPNEKGPP